MRIAGSEDGSRRTMSSHKPSIALVSARAARNLDEDQPPLERALRDAGAEVRIAEWDDASVDWRAFDLAVLRSTWDYTLRVEEFRAWARHVATCTRLINPEPVVSWNIDKHYFKELGEAGVPVIPSRFVDPGQDARRGVDAILSITDSAEIVVKPAIGAGSRDAQIHRRENIEGMRAHIQRLIDADRSAMLQPYRASVDERGETALLFYAGQFSHAIRKGPMLRSGAPPSDQVLFLRENISPRVQTADELRIAQQALAAIPFGTPLYARVDLLMNDKGAPELLELELTEPSMFFEHSQGAAARFASLLIEQAR